MNDFTKLYEDCHTAGGMSTFAFEDDPKRLAFTLARYKHTAKMLEGQNNVLEVGCADGFGSRIVRQHVGRLTATDVDPLSIEEAQKHASERWPIDFQVADVTESPVYWRKQSFDACYSLDVLEHISDEPRFLASLHAIAPVTIIGTPSLESQPYASRLSREGHINCKSGETLRKDLHYFWNHVFIFSMNDEAIGTGFLPMAHYLLALCVR